MWSGPRNLSTALMRSFENRNDTKVIDDPIEIFLYYMLKIDNQSIIYSFYIIYY